MKMILASCFILLMTSFLYGQDFKNDSIAVHKLQSGQDAKNDSVAIRKFQSGTAYRVFIGQSTDPMGRAIGWQLETMKNSRGFIFDLYYAREKGPTQIGSVIPISFSYRDRLFFFSLLYGGVKSNNKARFLLSAGPLLYLYDASIYKSIRKKGIGGQVLLGPEFLVGDKLSVGIKIRGIYAHEFNIGLCFDLGVHF